MKKSRKALLASALSLLLCFTMLLGTTFAWFTDSVTSSNNIIKAGNLDIELYYQVEGQTDWTKVTENTNIFMEDALWEPGHTEVVKLKVVNEGSLALKYQLGVNIAGETGSKNVNGADFKLSQFIYYGIVEGGKTYTRDEAIAAVAGSAKPLNTAYSTSSTKLPAKNDGDTDETIVTMVVYMPTTVENDANHAKDAPVPTIKLGLNLIATQVEEESDSFGNDYDAAAEYPVVINFSVAQPIDPAKVENGALTGTMTVGDTNGSIYAEVPAGAQLADGATALELSVKTIDESEADITLDEGERATSLDIHVEGLAEDNKKPVFVTLEGYFKKNLNTTSVAMYHVENGETKEMSLVSLADLDAHNEFYYDPDTGNVVISTATFSEYTVVTNSLNPWEGAANKDWYNTNYTEFTLTTADQLAGFGQLVDEGNSFADKTVKLGADIDLGGTISFDPIGWGYANNSYNSDGVEGKVFSGTFDGDGYTIYGLYQNGWDLESTTGTVYTYTNCGGGLFASIANGTVKNLTISGADIAMECVEMGVLVGLSQGDCTYENIEIYDSKVANYQRATGGLIGEVSPLNGGGTTTISNVVIGSDVVVGSLWGDFDAPVGGVIGARWDDGNTTKIVMNNVTVAARLDVYNDVTSTYQWYAYRRAGMLIGNTERTAEDNDHLAAADFLTCTNVVVKYGDWVNYHYCEFSEEYNSPSWPWVRVEAGENCSAYSNPRWGVATDATGNAITDAHTEKDHANGGTCMELIPFNQLYGGGQGVYGQAEHDGVEVQDYYYKVEYINDGVTHVTVKVTDAELNDDGTFTTANSEAANAVESQMGEGYAVNYWMNAGSTMVEYIPVGNVEDVKLYPSFKDRYTATFVDQSGNILAWTTFVAGADGQNVKDTAKDITPPTVEDCTFDKDNYLTSWEVHYTDDSGKVTPTQLGSYDFTKADRDVTIYPIYTFAGDVNLIPIDNDGDGVTDEYHVGGYSNPNGQSLVEIPDIVNGIKITAINADAFSGYDGVHAVVIPTTVTTVGGNVLAVDWTSRFDEGETVTIYYEGSYADWIEKEASFATGWDNGLGTGSRIFFLNGTNKVDPNQGYLQFTREWTSTSIVSGYYVGDWSHNANVTADLQAEYIGYCNCSVSTTGDTAHIYVDASGNVMGRNDAGTPVSADGKEINFEDGGWLGTDKLTDGTDTYYRYRPDKAYWEGVTIA